MMPEDPKTLIIPPSPGPSPRAQPALHGGDVGSCRARRAAAESPAVERFKSCRWRAQPEDGQFARTGTSCRWRDARGSTPKPGAPTARSSKVRRAPRKRPGVLVR